MHKMFASKLKNLHPIDKIRCNTKKMSMLPSMTFNKKLHLHYVNIQKKVLSKSVDTWMCYRVISQNPVVTEFLL